MRSHAPWRPARLLRRYKRFLADIQLGDGSELTIHCPNTGSMKNCVLPGSPCWYSTSDNAKRKYPHTWEVATAPGGHLAGVNTGRANTLVAQALEQRVIRELASYTRVRREVSFGQEKSRVDFLLQGEGPDCYVEVKSVTLMEDDGRGCFPDAVSERGRRHLRELQVMVAAGHRAVLLFCVQHTGVRWVEPADHIDPAYGDALREAAGAGVEVIAYQAEIVPAASRIALVHPLPVVLLPVASREGL